MKLSPESPVEFLEPLSRLPERAYAAGIATPFGPLALAGDGEALLAVRMNVPLDRFVHDISGEWNADVRVDPGLFREVIERLEEYFERKPGPVRAVVRPLPVTPFVHAVHSLMARIPYGETVAYGELAALAGNPRAARAVGGACGRNPVLIIVPCHRVVASHGLGGFGGGLDLKKQLLHLEGVR
jgi:methylated-DNA-[protein]-cysteine S-methyltransferase